MGLEFGKVGWSFSNSLSKPSIPTAMKERTEVHGFFKQVLAGVSNGVRIKGGGARRKAAYAYGGRSVSASLNVTE